MSLLGMLAASALTVVVNDGKELGVLHWVITLAVLLISVDGSMLSEAMAVDVDSDEAVRSVVVGWSAAAKRVGRRWLRRRAWLGICLGR